MKILFKGFNYSQDGPGNRLVYHLQGCNLHCPWCSNPESIPEDGVLLVKSALRDSWCPFGGIVSGKLTRIPCANCEKRPCVANSSGALSFSCFPMTPTDILEEAQRGAKLFFDGGGVTFTGGEPSLQFDELANTLALLKRHKIHTAIETNGTHPRLPELFDFTDYLIIDCKHYNSQKHREFLGADNERVLENIRTAAAKHKQVLVRIPLIRGFNADRQDANNFAAFFKSFNTSNTAFELLRYHEYGKDKWAQCGCDYTMSDGFVDDACLAVFREVFINSGLKLINT